MKNFTKLIGIIAMVAVLAFAVSCSKNEASGGTNGGNAAQARENLQNALESLDDTAIAEAAKTVDAETLTAMLEDAVPEAREKILEFANPEVIKELIAANVIPDTSTPTVAPASDFEYELTDDGEGVLIKRYIGSGGNIIVPDTIEGFPVTEARGHCFSATMVTSVVLPDSLAEFLNKQKIDTNVAQGQYMFENCTKLQSVTFPKGLNKILPFWFQGCTALASITIPDTVTEIGESAFQESGLTSIVIPEGVTRIGNALDGSTFRYCKNLTSLTLPESIKEIGVVAFEGCTSLETINLPSHQINFGSGFVFSGCSKLSLTTQKALHDAGYTGSF